MCCPLNHINGKLIIQDIVFDKTTGVYHIEANYDRSPRTKADRVFRFFQRLELVEKIAEIADETFHLFGTLLQFYTSPLVYKTLSNLHHAAHDVEHVLHAFCFIGDLTRLMTGKFFEYQDQEQTRIDYWRSISRICHTTSHFFSTASFLAEHKLCQIRPFENFLKCSSIFSVLGYAIWTITLIWQRHRRLAKDQFASDLGIHGAGCFFEALSLTKTAVFLTPYTSSINKIISLMGIIHASCFLQRLMPKDREEVSANFILTNKDSSSGHHHYHHTI